MMPAVYDKHKNTPAIPALQDAINQYEHEEVRDLAKFLLELVQVVLQILEDLGGEEEDE